MCYTADSFYDKPLFPKFFTVSLIFSKMSDTIVIPSNLFYEGELSLYVEYNVLDYL